MSRKSDTPPIKVMIVYEETSKGLVRKGTACFSTVEGKLYIRMENVFHEDPWSPKLVFKEA